MFFAGLILTFSATSYVADFLVRVTVFVTAKIFKRNWPQRLISLVRLLFVGLSFVGLGFIIFGSIFTLSEYELIADYDREPGLLYSSSMQLVTSPHSKGQQIGEAEESGKYEEAFLLKKVVAAETERTETESIGRPGLATATALGGVAWYALLAKRYNEALAASERAISLAPHESWIETNRAHALLLLGRIQEARTLYLERKGTKLWGSTPWADAVREDFKALRKANIESPSFAEIENALQGAGGT
jgi:tetratricopeptide (TPR) repeat protein